MRKLIGRLAVAGVTLAAAMTMFSAPADAADAHTSVKAAAKPATVAPLVNLVIAGGSSFPRAVNFCSSNLKACLSLQIDGNLVLRDLNTNRAWWWSNTVGSGVSAAFQTDGNLVVRNSAGTAVFASNTCCNSGSRLYLQDDGNMVIRRSDGFVLWKTNTVH
jgi:hypothetical protein